jgi:hypothetical protein
MNKYISYYQINNSSSFFIKILLNKNYYNKYLIKQIKVHIDSPITVLLLDNFFFLSSLQYPVILRQFSQDLLTGFALNYNACIFAYKYNSFLGFKMPHRHNSYSTINKASYVYNSLKKLLMEHKTVGFKALIYGQCKGGFLAYYSNIKGFLPNSCFKGAFFTKQFKKINLRFFFLTPDTEEKVEVEDEIYKEGLEEINKMQLEVYNTSNLKGKKKRKLFKKIMESPKYQAGRFRYYIFWCLLTIHSIKLPLPWAFSLIGPVRKFSLYRLKKYKKVPFKFKIVFIPKTKFKSLFSSFLKKCRKKIFKKRIRAKKKNVKKKRY